MGYKEIFERFKMLGMYNIYLTSASLRLLCEMMWDEGFRAWNLSSGKQKKVRIALEKDWQEVNKGKEGFLSSCEGSLKRYGGAYLSQ